MGFAGFILNWWLWIIVGAVALFIAWRSWISVPQNRLKYDFVKLRTPLLGKLLRDVAVARFTRTLGTLTAAGLPILDALKITRDTLGNVALANAVDAVQEQVSSGKPLADPLEESGLFPPLLVQVVNLGERSGKLEEMLLHSATAFDRQVNASLIIFTKALPPILLIVMAALACFVLSAILLPLLELQSLIR
jgi:type II secretory pathway component PulF